MSSRIALVLTCLLSTPVHAKTGSALYAVHCASCHGANLEGQPDWRGPREDGTYPAPPHNAEGHTWHHDDAMLFDYVARGGQAVLDDMGVSYRSGMPAFAGTLSDDEIRDILAFIAASWPERIHRMRAERSGG